MKTDLADVFRRSSAVSDSRITQLGMEIQIQINNKNLIESKLEEATKEPGMKRYAAFSPSLIFYNIYLAILGYVSTCNYDGHLLCFQEEKKSSRNSRS